MFCSSKSLEWCPARHLDLRKCSSSYDRWGDSLWFRRTTCCILPRGPHAHHLCGEGQFRGQFRMSQDVSECFQFQPWPALKYCLMKSLGLICLFKFVYPADRIIRILRRFFLASQLGSPCKVIKSVVLSKGLLEEFEKSRIITTGDTWFSWYCMVAHQQESRFSWILVGCFHSLKHREMPRPRYFWLCLSRGS